MNMLQEFPHPSTYKVLIRCNTYNQSKCIEQTLRGFTIQQTNFPFLVYVIDDASTDGEQEVLKKWIDSHCHHNEIKTYNNDLSLIIIARDNTNNNCTYAFNLLKKNLYCKPEKVEIHNFWRSQCEYEAICEGDDYWIEPLKLQRQTDFLDGNPDYTMSFHSASEHWSDGLHEDKVFSTIQDRDYFGVELFEKWIVPTASVMYRIDVLTSDLYKKASKTGNFVFGDTPLFVTCAELGKVRGCSDVMCVYQRSTRGATFGSFTLDYKKYLKRANHFLSFYTIFGPDYISGLRKYQTQVWYCVLKNPFKFSLWIKDLSNSLKLSCGGFLKSFFYCIKGNF